MSNEEMNNNNAVRKLLASAALATAIISWITTAQGLNLYVFENYWQAAIISAAIQGTLFAFSVNAIPLIKKLNYKGKLAMVILWIALLMASSIFSFVYISKTVYSDRLLSDDANRILANESLEKYFVLEEILELERKELESSMGKYTDVLAGDGSGVKLSEETIIQIESRISDLDGIIDENGEKKYENIVSVLKKIKEGHFSSWDIDALTDYIENGKKGIDDLTISTQSRIDFLSVSIEGINMRLVTFSNVNSDVYIKLNNDKAEYEKEKLSLLGEKEALSKEKNKLEDCLTVINNIDNTLEKTLYNEAQNLRTYMNEDIIDTDKMQDSAEKIYNVLLDNNVLATDERLDGYRDFCNTLDEYKILIESEGIIENGISTVYDYASVSTDITSFWRTRLNELQDVTKNIPQKYFDEYSKELTKGEIIHLATTLDRLYLSDLNNFERAWSLLFEPIHEYKMLLWFSVVFAFGIDLFSFGTGMLLYFMKKR